AAQGIAECRVFGTLADVRQVIFPRIEALEEVGDRVIVIARDAEIGDAHLAGGPHVSPEALEDPTSDAERFWVCCVVRSGDWKDVCTTSSRTITTAHAVANAVRHGTVRLVSPRGVWPRGCLRHRNGRSTAA